MMKRPLAACAAVFVLALAASPAAGQSVSFGVAAGPTFPLGDLGDVVDMGWHAQGTVNFGAGVLPLGVRAEALYQQMGGDAWDVTQFAAFLTGVLTSPSAAFSPYLLGGVGVYNTDYELDAGSDILPPGSDTGSSTELGVNAGIGVDIGLVGYALVLEARYHHAFRDGGAQQTLPISIGVRF